VTTEQAPAPRRTRGRGRVALLLLVLAAATAISALPTWFTAHGTEALHGTVAVTVNGTDAAPGVVAAALVLAASAAAVALVGRIGRWVVAAVVAIAGLLVLVSTFAAVRDPESAVHDAVARATGVGHVVGDVTTSAWPWIAVALGVVDVLAAVWLLRASRAWAGPSRRHEGAPGGAGGTGAPRRPEEGDDRAAWDALSRGDDPT
jgi:uncharacterized membrane protein (TIGR02234 family)